MRHARLGITPADRVWHCDANGTRLWCVLGAHAHQAMLEWILDGPGAPTPTAIERTIVSECIGQLLAVTAEMRWCESIGEPKSLNDLWESVLEISGKGASATIRLFTIAHEEAHGGAPPALDDVPLEVSAQLRPCRMRLDALLRWEPGVTVRLEGSATDICAQLQVVGGPVVYGTLGCVQGSRAVRLSGSAARRAAP